MKRCVIVTAAPVLGDRFVVAMRALLRSDDTVYAADNGWKLAERLGVSISCLIGDFDSGEQPPASVVSNVVRLPVVKDETDTLAAVYEAQKSGYNDFLILGSLGGRFDHTLANLAVMQHVVKTGGYAVMSDGQNEIHMLSPSRYTFSKREGYFSLLPYGGEVQEVSIKGALYNVKGITLTLDRPVGVSNAFVDETLEISFESGYLLLIFSKD